MKKPNSAPILYVYFDADRTLSIEMKDAQQEFDYSQFDIKLNVFTLNKQTSPQFSYDPVIEDGIMLFDIPRADALKIHGVVYYYELEYEIAQKRDVWIANRFISMNVPDAVGDKTVEVTINEDLNVVDVTGSVNTAKAIQAAADAEQALEDTETLISNSIASIESARDQALTAVGDAETSSVQAVNDARDAGVTAVENARDQGVGAIETARDSAITTINDLVTQAQTARDEAVTARDETQGLRNETEGFRDESSANVDTQTGLVATHEQTVGNHDDVDTGDKTEGRGLLFDAQGNLVESSDKLADETYVDDKASLSVNNHKEAGIGDHNDVNLTGAEDGDFLIRDAGVWKSFNSLEARMRLGVEKGFVISVKTDNAGVSDDNQFQFTGAVGDYTVEAYQNDSFVQRYTGLSGEQTITLPSAGTYTLRVLPEGATPFNQIRFNNGGDRLKMLDIRNWGDVIWGSLNNAFHGCENMIATYTDNIDLSSLDDMRESFRNSNFNGDVSKWDVSTVTVMLDLFRDTPFNGDVSNWDVSNVVTMTSLFFNSNFNGDVSKWDVSNAENIAAMFRGTPFNGNISQWDVSNVTNMIFVFRDTPFNGNISQWDVSNVTNMDRMFFNSNFNGDVSNWDVSNVTNMGNMFLSSPFSIENYNPLLENWSQLTLQNNVSFHAGNAQYSAGAPATARQSIIDNFNWSITDGGQE